MPELQAQPGVGTQPSSPPAGGAEQAPTATQPPAIAEGAPQAPPQIDLTQSEEFRRYQSAADRRFEAARKEAEEAKRRVAELESRMAQAEASSLPPDERARYYQGQLETVRAQQLQAEQARAEEAKWTEAAQRSLGKYGLTMQTPGLDLSGGPTADGYAKLMESALAIVATRTTAQQAQQQAAQRDQQIAALNATGVTQVDLGLPGAPAAQAANPIAEINDPTELLKLGFAALKKKG